jgi:Concanavalin A-like lectin/glucanases superfamily
MKNKLIINASWLLSLVLIFSSCQKMDHPVLGTYAKDANAPGGPLAFYVAFDGTTTNPLMNAVDSIRAAFAADNPLKSLDGIKGKGVQGATNKYIRYAKPNDWAKNAKNFTISFWYKKDGQTLNNKGTNGPEYIMSFPSSNGHWSGANLFVMLEGNNTKCAVKVMIADQSVSDNWFTWENENQIPGMLDNKWHHIAMVYSASTSAMSLYLDGVLNPLPRAWGTHGNINIDDTKISEMRIGRGPANGDDNDDWLASSWKGGIDQIRMYTTALSGAEVSALYANKQ